MEPLGSALKRYIGLSGHRKSPLALGCMVHNTVGDINPALPIIKDIP